MNISEPEASQSMGESALPVTGNPSIDAALAALNMSDDVHTHHDEIASVLDVVQQALNPTEQPRLPRP